MPTNGQSVFLTALNNLWRETYNVDYFREVWNQPCLLERLERISKEIDSLKQKEKKKSNLPEWF